MIFSSVLFLFIFLPIVMAIYFLIYGRLKNVWLLIASLFFYSWGEPQYVFLMLVSILVNYILGIIMEIARQKKRLFYSNVCLSCTILFDIGMLFYFKYFDFFVRNINQLFSVSIQLKNIALPIGISFYTFQIMSYVIDVYRGKVQAQRNILNLGLYISFFPQLIAGPIVRYIDIENQIRERKVHLDQVYQGMRFFIVGFSKKILLADQLASLVDSIFMRNGISAPSAWIGIVAYSLQIYFDFSGYSDMAIGLGKIFGFEFVKNFDFPYISKSIKEFWRRWHISLSTWFKDYVYIPLGGSRCKPWRSYVNLIIVFFLTGFWHGASWNFIVWGLYYVIFLIIERTWLGTRLEKLPVVLRHLYALFVIIIGWVFFRANDLTSALVYIKNMFVWNQDSWKDLYINMNKEYAFFMATGMIFSTPLVSRIGEKIALISDVLYDIILGLIFVLAISYMLGSGFSPFLYFRF